MNTLKVLIPTDFSVQAEFAYLMVQNLASSLQMEVHFLHVLSSPESVVLTDFGEFVTAEEFDISYLYTQKKIAERKLDELHQIAGREIHTHLRAGKLQNVLHHFAEDNHMDLIVMGTKGSWGVKEVLSGSETQTAARKSKIPILSLMCDRTDLKIKDILFIHDFNNVEQVKLPLLKVFAEVFQANIHFLHICTNPQENMQKIESKMNDVALFNDMKHVTHHIHPDQHIESGIVHFNQKKNMDLIFIGTHGKAGIFHESITAKLINHLFKPIVSFQINHS